MEVVEVPEQVFDCNRLQRRTTLPLCAGQQVDSNDLGGVPSASPQPPAPSRWSSFEQLQSLVSREGVGSMKGVQVGSAFCSKLDELVAASKFDSSDADYLRDGV